MGREIERKFLVDSDIYKQEAFCSNRIVQGYLNSAPERTVRIRIKKEKAYITVKGIGDESGVSRFEWEKEIPVNDAEELLELCEPIVIDKIRHEVKVGKHIFEVDEFFGTNAGLVIAEIELDDANEVFEKPQWLGKEVTGDIQYYNSSLSKKPVQKQTSINYYSEDKKPGIENNDVTFMKEALKEAYLALEKGEVPIGAVIVCNDRIIARGHNLTETLKDVTAHAEMQAITSAAQFLGGKYMTDCTLYVTVEPCVMCAGAIGWSQISRIVYGSTDKKRGYSLYAPLAMHPKAKTIFGVLEKECSELMTNFFKKKR